MDNFAESKRLYFEAVYLASRAKGAPERDAEGIFTCRGLALLYKQTNDNRYQEIDMYLRLAVAKGQQIGECGNCEIRRSLCQVWSVVSVELGV